MVHVGACPVPALTVVLLDDLRDTTLHGDIRRHCTSFELSCCTTAPDTSRLSMSLDG
jgi:hypothetical protein